MNGNWRNGCWLIVLSFAIASSSSGLAQEPKPKPGDPAAAVAEKKEKTDSAEPAVPDDPAVAAILETKSSTPGECIRAAKILSDLKRPDLAKQLLQKVIDAKLSQKDLAKLGEQFTSTMFLQLSAQADLRPQAQALADLVLSARNAELQNPQRLAELIKQLHDQSEEKRNNAFSGLMEARGAAMTAMIAVLADPSREAEHPRICTALAAMGRQASEPLFEVLDKADPKLKIQSIAILSESRPPALQLSLFKPYLSEKSDATVRAAAAAALRKIGGALPTKDQAVRLLTENSKNYFNLRQPMPGIVDGKADVWRWDEARRECTVMQLSASDAAREMSSRFARDAFAITPDDVGVVRLYLATLLEAAAYQKGLPATLDDNDSAVVEAKQLGAKAIEEAMDFAMSNGHIAAATAAAQILGKIGQADELLYFGSKISPLALALHSTDRRLRISAARAIVSLKPQRPYAGSSYMLPTLAFFASTSGQRRVLLAGGNVEDMRKKVSVFSAAGFKVDNAVDGREVMRMAVSSPDYELAMIDMGIDQPPINMLLQQLRHDYRSADLRVGLIARDGFLERAEHLSESDTMAKAFSRPHDDASLAWQLEQLATIKPQEFVGFDERQRQANEAMDMLAELGRTSGKLYDIRLVEKAALTALYTPSLSLKAIDVLAMINSPESQRTLADIAGNAAQTLQVRQAAVSAFRRNVQSFGILLTTEEINKQYQLYNASKILDQPTQKILGLILDCLEAPTKSEGKRMKDEG